MTIGMFDSGVGGLSILREVHRRLPGNDVVYLADQAWAPYGERSLEAVRERSVAITDFLLGCGVEVVVVACNSASAAALRHLRLRFPGIPFVGMEPAVKPAAQSTNHGVVGVLATEATFQGELYASVVDHHADGVVLVESAAAGVALAVEEGRPDDARRLLKEYLEPMIDAGVDRLVLGCTHYPFVLDEIRGIVGPDIHIVDPAPAVARQVGRVSTAANRGSETRYLTTGDAERFGAQVERLLGLRTEPAQIVI